MAETKICKCCGRKLPLREFGRSHLGVYNTCKECKKKKHVLTLLAKKDASNKADEVQEVKKMRLKDFTPRELMIELKERGYEFTMKYVEVHVINSNNL